MIRAMLAVLLPAVVFFIAGCGELRQSAAPQPSSNNDLFRRQTERFDRQHADHVKNSSDAVRGYLRYRYRNR
jgi:hypothetical protein